MIAERVTPSSEDPPASSPARISMSTTWGRPLAAAIASAPTAAITASCATASWCRRSTRSAIAPPSSETTIIGPSSNAPSNPTSAAECERTKIWNGSATSAAWVPRLETTCPANSSRKSRDSRTGEMSRAVRRRNVSTWLRDVGAARRGAAVAVFERHQGVGGCWAGTNDLDLVNTAPSWRAIA
jgi:hypothetical protein